MYFNFGKRQILKVEFLGFDTFRIIIASSHIVEIGKKNPLSLKSPIFCIVFFETM